MSDLQEVYERWIEAVHRSKAAIAEEEAAFAVLRAHKDIDKLAKCWARALNGNPSAH